MRKKHNRESSCKWNYFLLKGKVREIFIAEYFFIDVRYQGSPWIYQFLGGFNGHLGPVAQQQVDSCQLNF